MKGLRAKLLSERAVLRDGLTASAESVQTVELDQTRVGRVSRIDALQQQAMAIANESSAKVRLAALDAALVRMDNDDYGECVECAQAISPARLAARPEARLCIECKSISEQT